MKLFALIVGLSFGASDAKRVAQSMKTLVAVDPYARISVRTSQVFELR